MNGIEAQITKSAKKNPQIGEKFKSNSNQSISELR